MIILGPPDIGLNARKLPHAVNPPIPHSAFAVSMSLNPDLGHLVICVLLVRNPHLMIARYLRLARHHPFRRANEMLGLDARITKKFGVGGHAYEGFGWHSFP